MNKGQLLGDFQLGDQDCRDLGPCICSECSGKNDDGVRVWKRRGRQEQSEYIKKLEEGVYIRRCAKSIEKRHGDFCV